MDKQTVSPLEVTVLQATNLLNLERFGKIDPYVSVEYQGIIKKTSVKKGELNPVWNETLIYDLKGQPVREQDELQVLVKDWELVGANRLVGKCTILMGDVLRAGGTLHLELKLADANQRTVDGILVIGVKYVLPAGTNNAEQQSGRVISDQTDTVDGGIVDGDSATMAAAGQVDSAGGVSQPGRGGVSTGRARQSMIGHAARGPLSTKPQDFQLRVRLIEARQLQPSNGNPVCRVRCHKQSQQSRIIKSTNSPYWGETIFFNFVVSPAELFEQPIYFEVFNARTLRGNSLIGSFKIEQPVKFTGKCDVGLIYDEPKHCLINKWLLLSLPDKSEGPRGYLKICVALLGPGDDAPSFAAQKQSDQDDIEANLLRPAGVHMKPATFKMKVYCAEDLPRMDSNFMQGVKRVFGSDEKKELVDPYLVLSFAGNKTSTKVMYNNSQPEWNQELRIGLNFPSMCEKIKMQLMDWDRVGKDDRIASASLNTHEVAHGTRRDDGFLPTFGPCFVNFYGAPREFSAIPTEFDSLNEGMGQGVAYRGRALVELVTVIDEKPLTVVEDILPDDVMRVQKFKRRRNFKLHSAFLNASMISAVDSAVEFEVSIGNYGNKLDEHLPPCVSTTQPSYAVFDGQCYYYLPWGNDKPSVTVDCHWEDILFRLEAVNLLLGIADRLESNINTLRVGQKANLPVEELAQHLISILDQLIMDCQKKMPRPSKTQIENDLDVNIRAWRESEMSLLASNAATLRDTVTSVKDAFEEMEGFLNTLQRMSIEPQNSIPDVVVWMISGDKRIAYCRIPSHLLIWSSEPEYRGKLCGKLDTFQLIYPGNKRERENCWEIPALLRARFWLGLEQHERDWSHMQTEGEMAVYAETYENQVSLMGSWTGKGPMSRPKWSDATGQVELNKDDFKPPKGWRWEGDWYLNPELSMLFDKDAGRQYYTEEVYEVQSRLPGGNWGQSSVPWTDVKGDATPSKTELQLTPGWEWQNDWQVDLNRAIDEYGWEYAVEISYGGFGAVEKRYHLCRRRRWVRLRRFVKTVTRPNDQTKKAMVSSDEGWEYAPMFSMKFHAVERKVDVFRRRRWHRRMVKEPSPIDEDSGACYFQIPNKDKSKDGIDTILVSPRMFLTCRKPYQYQLRAYIYQARDLLAADKSGLSDPFARVIFQNQSLTTEFKAKSLSPTWDQTLIFDSVEIYGNPRNTVDQPPQIIVELFDFDVFGKPEFLGRTFAAPVIHLDPSNAVSPMLHWYTIKKGDTGGGELLAAFEAYLVDGKELPFVPPKRGKYYMVPNGIRPQLIRTGIEVMCWGVRSMSKYQLVSVKSPSVEIEIGGQVVQSNVIRNTADNPNFDDPLLFFDVMLPKEELYAPPVNIIVRDNRQFGRKPIVGVHTIKSLEGYHCDALQPGDDVELTLSKQFPTAAVASDRQDHIVDMGAPDDNANLLQKQTADAAAAKTKKQQQLQSVTLADSIDWWSKYYASKGELAKCSKYLELGYDKLQIFPNELEKVEEFAGFSDFCDTLRLSRGKNIEDEESSIVGEVKATFKVYPLPSDPSADLPPKIIRNLPPTNPIDCIVRVYVIRAYDLQPKDPNGLADPYIKIKIGKKKKSNRDDYIPNTLEPVFGKMFEIQTTIPVAKDLRVSIRDYDVVSADDTIGDTVIDLENRYLTKYRALVGLPRTYCTVGPCAWRDGRRPTEILNDFCLTNLRVLPIYESNEVVRIGEKVYTLATFESKKPSHGNLGPRIERLALHVLNTLPLSMQQPLVPEHIETRPLFNPLQPGIEQGRVELWVDLFPVALGPPGPPVDIKPRSPKKLELRIVIWNTRDVVLDETSITGERMSDIYVKGWIAGSGQSQKTDVHYRSLDGEGNFNWRFVFPFDYIPAEQVIVIKKKEHFWSLDETEHRVPPTLMIQIWDNDKFSPDDFLGTLELNLQSMPMPSKNARGCTLEQLPTTVGKTSGGKSPTVNLMSLFEQKRVKGFWPCYSDDSGARILTGKVEMELELITEEDARQRSVGRARDEPNQHPALEPPKRPDTSFLWFASPWKTCRFIVWRHYKWYFITAIILLFLIVFIILFIYAIPGTAAKKMFGVS